MSKETGMHNWRIDPNATSSAETMISQLAGVCNGASTWDGAGFSKFDTHFGHSLAERFQQGRPWTVKQAEAALKLLRKYRNQLGGPAVVDEFLTAPTFRQRPVDPSAAATPDAPKRNPRLLSSRDHDAVLTFPYDPELVTAIKALRGEHRGRKYWASWDSNPRAILDELVRGADILIGNHRDISLLLGKAFSDDGEDRLARLDRAGNAEAGADARLLEAGPAAPGRRPNRDVDRGQGSDGAA